MSHITETIKFFTPKDLGLIVEYAERYQNGNLKGREVEHVRFSFLENWLPLPIVGNIFGNHHNTDKTDKKNKNYGFAIAISALVSSVFYVIAIIPKFYGLAKELYFTRTIEKLSNKKPCNECERRIITNLKELINADLSSDRLRTQKIKAVAALGFISSSATYVASYSCDIAKDTWDHVEGVAPKFLVNLAKRWIPESARLSDQTKDNIIKFLSNNNLVDFAKYTIVTSVGLLAINGIYNLYKDFFYDTENPKDYLNQKALEIKNTINEMRHGPLGSILHRIQFQSIA